MKTFKKLSGIVHGGCCDASAAVSIGPTHFLVANDEDNILRLYDSDKSQGPSHSVDITAYFKNNPDKKETDIEGGSELDGIVYWITSHGADKDGRHKPERRQLFATRTVNKEGTFSMQQVGFSFTGLLDSMSNFDAMKKYDLWKAAEKPPKEEGALNLEGLAATPEKSLLIGFRNPIPDGKALLLPLLNPRPVIDGEATPDFGKPFKLDLDGLGIRDIEYWKSEDAYVILAGRFDEEQKFGVYLWSGKSESRPERIESIDLDDLSPEAIVVYQDTNRVQIISDDGAHIVGGKECKKLAPGDRAFRSILFESLP